MRIRLEDIFFGASRGEILTPCASAWGHEPVEQRCRSAIAGFLQNRGNGRLVPRSTPVGRVPAPGHAFATCRPDGAVCLITQKLSLWRILEQLQLFEEADRVHVDAEEVAGVCP